MSEMERKEFSKQELLEMLEKIGEKLGKPVVAFMLGGGAMCFRNQKISTRDLDLVFENKNQALAFCGVLPELGFGKKGRLEIEYEEMKAEGIWEEKGGFRIDVFAGKVCGALELSEGVRERSGKLVVFGKLEVRTFSNEDVVLFKSVTDRDRDVDDIAAIVKTASLDWNGIKSEIREQTLHYPNLPTLMFNKSIDLKEKHEISPPIVSWLKRKSNEQILRLEFKQRLEAGMTKEQALDSLAKHGFSKKEMEKLLES